MLPIFPATLPRMKQFSLSPHELRAMTSRRSLPLELRRRSGGRGAIFNVAWMLTDAQFTAFETFYKEDLSYGNGWFLVPTPLSGSMYSVVQFTEEYSSRKVGFNGKEVSAELETHDRSLFVAPSLDPYWSNVVLLVTFEGAVAGTTFIDRSPLAHTLSTVGDTHLSADVAKFGGTSGAFDGTGDRVEFSNSSSLQFSGDFTVELHVYPTSSGTFENFVQQSNDLAGAWWLRRTNTNALAYGFVGGSDRLIGGAIPQGVWTHVAMAREGDQIRLFVNGVVVNTETYAGVFGNTSGVAQISGQSYPFEGYLYDLRITNGVARYTSAFSPPAAPFPY